VFKNNKITYRVVAINREFGSGRQQFFYPELPTIVDAVHQSFLSCSQSHIWMVVNVFLLWFLRSFVAHNGGGAIRRNVVLFDDALLVIVIVNNIQCFSLCEREYKNKKESHKDRIVFLLMYLARSRFFKDRYQYLDINFYSIALKVLTQLMPLLKSRDLRNISSSTRQPLSK
jgi:hypothetical protein